MCLSLFKLKHDCKKFLQHSLNKIIILKFFFKKVVRYCGENQLLKLDNRKNGKTRPP